MDFEAALKKKKYPKTESPPSQPMELAPSVPDISPARLTLARYDQEIDNLIMLANSHEIIDAPSQGQAVMIAGNTRKLRKAIDEVRNRYIQPALDYQRQVNALANNYKDRLLAAEKGLTQKLQSTRCE